MEINRQQVINDLQSLEADPFFSKHFFERCPYIFERWSEAAAWRHTLAAKLRVDAAELTLVGSAALGVSLKEYKNFKVFSEESDVDVAVISSYYFTVAWRFLRQSKALYARLERLPS